MKLNRFLPRRSLTAKLLLAFLALASLSVLSSLVGWLSLSELKSGHDALAQRAVPLFNQSRSLAELGGRIVLTGQFLTQVDDPAELIRSEQRLKSDLAALNRQLADLDSIGPNTSISSPLLATSERVADLLSEQVKLVGQRLAQEHDFNQGIDLANQVALDMAQLVDSQLANAETAIVARSIGLYGEAETRVQHVDDLVEVDLLQLRRMSELKYSLIRLRQQLVLLPQATDRVSVQSLRERYASLSRYLPLMIQEVRDPERRQAMEGMMTRLAQGERLYELRQRQLTFAPRLSDLSSQVEQEFARLNSRMDDLLLRANNAISDAGRQADEAFRWSQLTLGVIGVLALGAGLLLVWQVVLKDVVVRINYYTGALLSLAEGRVDVEVTAKGEDELSRLAGAIRAFKENVIARRRAESELRQQHRRLEQTVSERTAELSLVNRKLAEQLKVSAQAKEQAEEASRAKSSFLATISHEIRTPMNGILGMAQLMESDNLTAQQQNQLQVIRRSGESLLEVINDVLDYSKIEAGGLELLSEPCDVAALAQEVVDTLGPVASAKGLALQLEVDAGLAPAYLGDPGKLRQIMMNLASNGVKFTREGQVRLLVTQRDQQFLFQVIDSGPGIDEDRQQAIFEPFRQAGAHHTPGGTGLGLSISRRLAEAMGGSLTVESEPGQGATFTLRVPSFECAAPQEEESELTLPPKARLLVVEDNPTNQLVISGFLKRLGQSFILASDGAEALAALEQGPFDLALLDINLPDISGDRLRPQLVSGHRRHFGANLACLAMSAHAFTEQVEAFIASGFDGFIAKPLRLAELARVLAGQGDAIKAVENSDEMHLLNLRQLEQDLAVLGRETVEIMCQRFAEDAAELLACDSEEWKAAVHRLKGGAGSLGMIRLASACSELEISGHWSEETRESLIALCNGSVEAIEQWLQEKG
ncbi:TMAO reductase system sensor histidine kinase/response regulator TorS [Ferrimonas sediminicola]|uniref:Sensory/regulatory protein RpfC n=1 Tax=Ferrimonas sediminicola TaxID=2569538 RepID=A0A4U1BH00_9GAMM|nr:TMAO reductase system sensor histidine kinase/response regulator TorS [Ferrimonas sediminicola]TKB50491.1 TMAO reductase system sensor histidine kinase/response regulator TorS [Ferrimonas sediminicola]